MNIVGCLDVPTRGQFFLDGIDVRTLDEAALSRIRNRKIGFVFQSFNLIPRTTALANVELPLLYAGVKSRERRRRAEDALGSGRALRSQPPLPERALRRPAAAGRAGARDRVRLRRSSSPTSRPATSTRRRATRSWTCSAASTRAGARVVVITHEEEIAAYAKRTVRLRDGLIVEDMRRVAVAALPPRLDVVRSRSAAS